MKVNVNKEESVENRKTALELEIERSMIRQHPDWIKYIRNPSKELCEIAISSFKELQGKGDFKNISIVSFIEDCRINFGK